MTSHEEYLLAQKDKAFQAQYHSSMLDVQAAGIAEVVAGKLGWGKG